jgi:hypothetical protein
MTRLRATILALLVSTAFAGCGGDDGPSDPGNGSTTLTMSIVSGNGQVGAIAAALASPFVVEIEDQNGNPVSGTSVSWTLAAAAGPNATLSASSTTTGTDGRSSVSFTLGDAAGSYQVRASVTGSSATFTAEATASGGLEVVSGDGQVGLSGQAAAQPLVVRAVGNGGASVPGVEVTFSVAQSAGAGASVSPTTATTGADGRASTTLTFGDGNGAVTVTASTDGADLSFSGYACGGDAGATTLDLQPGEDAVITGADLACVQLPAHAAGAEYELAVTPLPQALGFNDMTLAIGGSPAASPAPALIAQPDAAPRARAGSFSLFGGASDLTDWRGPQYEWDMQLRELEKPLRAQIQANTVGGSSFGLMAAPPQVGDVMDFGFSCVTQTQFPNTPTDITAEVVAVSDNAVIFEDTLSRGVFTGTDYTAIATNFDDVIIGTDTLYFGAPNDVTGDIAPGQVVILYTQGVNQMTEDYSDGFIAGFFCPLDLGFAGGNNAKMFYLLVPDPSGDLTPGDDANLLTKTATLRITDNTVAHEFQHLINAQVGGANGAAQEVWINEGLSHLAEEVVGHATGQAAGITEFAPGNELGSAELLQSGTAVDILNKYYLGNWVNLSLYLDSPGDTAALLNSQDPLGEETFRMRGANWSFLRYLLDRFGTPATEWQMTRALITDGATVSREAVTNVFGVPFNELAADWAAMFSVEDRADLGGPVRTSLAMTSYKVRDVYENINAPPYLGSWPLMPAVRQLSMAGMVEMDLFTGTSSFVTLRNDAASGGTGLRLMEAGTGADVNAAIMPYMVIVRTK